jgi:hypothetical protein
MFMWHRWQRCTPASLEVYLQLNEATNYEEKKFS